MHHTVCVCHTLEHSVIVRVWQSCCISTQPLPPYIPTSWWLYALQPLLHLLLNQAHTSVATFVARCNIARHMGWQWIASLQKLLLFPFLISRHHVCCLPHCHLLFCLHICWLLRTLDHSSWFKSYLFYTLASAIPTINQSKIDCADLVSRCGSLRCF